MLSTRWPAISYKAFFALLFALSALLYSLPAIMPFLREVCLFLTALPFIPLSSTRSTHGQRGVNVTCGSTQNANILLQWHQPASTKINDLSSALESEGVYGFIFNSSQGSLDTYNWCNMPHTNPLTYPKASSDFELEYVEVIHRHHKRTPYASNTFPEETYPWNCDEAALTFGGKPINPYGNDSAATYWDVYTSSSNLLQPDGFNGTCQFPQITREGLDDSWQHGVDLKVVYHDLLGFLPADYSRGAVSYRVTNNVITSQVASMLIAGMYPAQASLDTALLIQPDSIDSLEPSYSCPYSSDLFDSYGSGSSSPGWRGHMDRSAVLKTRLDSVSGVDPNDSGWTMSWDHYCRIPPLSKGYYGADYLAVDNLSSRLCHSKPLPCNANNSSKCVSMAEANEVFRLGQYEYSFIYRDNQQSLPASVAGYGIWIAELGQNIRQAMEPVGSQSPESQSSTTKVKYRHNVAHDGSMSRLLSILQLDEMVWPGMGAEVVFELYSKASCWYVRVLWGGQVMKSSHPALGHMDMLPVDHLLYYFEGLVGPEASKVPSLCVRD